MDKNKVSIKLYILSLVLIGISVFFNLGIFIGDIFSTGIEEIVNSYEIFDYIYFVIPTIQITVNVGFMIKFKVPSKGLVTFNFITLMATPIRIGLFIPSIVFILIGFMELLGKLI